MSRECRTEGIKNKSRDIKRFDTQKLPLSGFYSLISPSGPKKAVVRAKGDKEHKTL